MEAVGSVYPVCRVYRLGRIWAAEIPLCGQIRRRYRSCRYSTYEHRLLDGLQRNGTGGRADVPR